MFSKIIYTVGAIILLILLFLFYKGNQYRKLIQDIDNMDIEQIEAYLISQGIDIEGQRKSELRSNIEQIDRFFEDIFTQEQIKRLKSVETEQLDYYEKNGLSSEELLNQQMGLTLDTLQDMFVSERFIRHIEVFYRSILLAYNKEIGFDSVSPFIAAWMEENISFDRQVKLIRKTVEDRVKVYGGENEDGETILRIREKLLNDIDRMDAGFINSSAYQTLVKEALEEFRTYPLRTEKEENYHFISFIAGTYHKTGKLLKVDVTPLLLEWYNQQTEYTPSPIEQLAEESLEYVEMMREHGLIKERERKQLETIINRDIDIFRNMNDSIIIMEAINKSLSELKKYLFDTEDREFFSGLYYQLAAHKNLNINKQLNEWLYGSWVNSIPEENKLPWE